MKRFIYSVIALLPLVFSSVVAATEIDAPDVVIRGAANELAVALKENRELYEADSQALYSLIDQILEPRFDRKYAAQLVLARAWRTASETQRTAFTDAFYGTMLRRYADGVLQFDEDRMTVHAYKAGKKDDKRTQVNTTVVLDNGEEVPVNYGLVRRVEGWKVYDVVIEGISYVRNFRTELNAEVSAKGLDAVISRMQAEAGDAPKAL